MVSSSFLQFVFFVDKPKKFPSLFELHGPEIFDNFERIFGQLCFLCYLAGFAHLFDWKFVTKLIITLASIFFIEMHHFWYLYSLKFWNSWVYGKMNEWKFKQYQDSSLEVIFLNWQSNFMVIISKLWDNSIEMDLFSWHDGRLLFRLMILFDKGKLSMFGAFEGISGKFIIKKVQE